MKFARIVPLLALVTISPLACAQTRPSDVDLFRAFNASDIHKWLITRALVGVPPAVFQRCASLVSKGSRITPWKPVTFDANGLPNSGAWKESFPVSGCGDDTILNFYFTAGKDDKINAVAGIPGTTISDPVLQHDTLLYATMGAHQVARDCKSFDVKYARFEAFGQVDPATPDPGPGAKYRPRWETWTMVGCGHVIDVPIDYTPNDKGTLIVMPGHGVRERPAR